MSQALNLEWEQSAHFCASDHTTRPLQPATESKPLPSSLENFSFWLTVLLTAPVLIFGDLNIRVDDPSHTIVSQYLHLLLQWYTPFPTWLLAPLIKVQMYFPIATFFSVISVSSTSFLSVHHLYLSISPILVSQFQHFFGLLLGLQSMDPVCYLFSYYLSPFPPCAPN